jgi:PD-(D/E)XK nuclease superfamily
MIVSNTEVSTHNLCERQHWYRFNQSLEPRHFSVNSPIGLGIIGHAALERYYLVFLEGGSVDDAKQVAMDYLKAEALRLSDDFLQLMKLTHLVQLIDAYAEYYRVEPFKVLAVEKVYQTHVAGNINYGLKLDLLVEWLTGVERGSIVIVDHKFVYNFKSRAELEMDCQLPKYTKTLRDNGYDISHSVFNQIRYREMKAPEPTDLFKRSRMDSTKYEIGKMWEEQYQTALRIANPSSDYPIRTQHLLTCRGCFFQSLCKADLQGLDTVNMRIADYKPSEYGYVDMIDTGAHFS